MTDRDPPAPYDPALLARAADMLALPERVCRRRDCRRKQRCSWVFSRTQQPCCLANLDAEQRRLFDIFASHMESARVNGAWDSGILCASPYAETRALQDAAVEATRPLHRYGRLAWYRRFAAGRERLPPPARAGDDPFYD